MGLANQSRRALVDSQMHDLLFMQRRYIKAEVVVLGIVL